MRYCELAFVFCVLGVFPPAYCQKHPILMGTLVDRETRLPIKNAYVVAVGTVYKTFTDSAGNYVLAGLSPGPQLIKVSHLAYVPDSCSITIPAGCDTIVLSGQLHQRLLQVEDITVTGKRNLFERNYRLTARRVVTAKDIGQDAVIGMESLLQRYAPFAQGGFALYVDGFRLDPSLLTTYDVHQIKEMYVWRWLDAPEEFKTGLGMDSPYGNLRQNVWGILTYVVLIKTHDW